MACAYYVIKNAQNRPSVALHVVSHHIPQRLQNVIKNRGGGMLVTEILKTCTQLSNKHLLKHSCKNKVLIKIYSA